uniref:C-C motif chemokine n=1 Tax=Oryzias sinensis TaxID=183150 RepID=A0A8C8DD55_9TELE
MRGWVDSRLELFLCGPFYISRVGSVVHHHSLTDFTRGKERQELLTKEIMVSVKVAFIVIAFLAVCSEQTDAAMGFRCCRTYMKGRLPFPIIKGYSVQTITELCPINAIIFHTRKGKTCANPALNWVMEYVERLRKLAQKVHNESRK